jgi:hypothetical protein
MRNGSPSGDKAKPPWIRPFGVEPPVNADFAQQIDGGLFQHAGADARFDIGAAALLEEHAIDPGLPQQLRQEQPGRARSDDSDLRAHVSLSRRRSYAPGSGLHWR